MACMRIALFIVGSYLLIINVFTFIVRGIDKRRSANQQWRIKEKTLLRLTAVGGFLGALVGMNMFHHKTIKGEFLRWLMLIMFGWVVIFAVFAYFWRVN